VTSSGPVKWVAASHSAGAAATLVAPNVCSAYEDGSPAMRTERDRSATQAHPARTSARRLNGRTSDPVPHPGRLLLHVGAVGATVDGTVDLHAVPDHPHAAMGAGGREGVDGALEAVEDVAGPIHHDLERLIVTVPASLAMLHITLPVRPMGASPEGRLWSLRAWYASRRLPYPIVVPAPGDGLQPPCAYVSRKFLARATEAASQGTGNWSSLTKIHSGSKSSRHGRQNGNTRTVG
jgi:hypothetical protein